MLKSKGVVIIVGFHSLKTVNILREFHGNLLICFPDGQSVGQGGYLDLDDPRRNLMMSSKLGEHNFSTETFTAI